MIEAIAAVQLPGLNIIQSARLPTSAVSAGPARTPTISFAQMLSDGLQYANAEIAEADRLVVAFATDSTIPAHQVTLAIEEARLSLEFMIQVRNRMVEGFQQIMNMQV